MKHFLLCFLFFSLQVKAASEITAVTEHLPPYQAIDGTGKISGFSVEVVKALGTAVQDNISIEVLPWERAYRKALNDENVMIFSIYRIPSREPLFNWVGKVDENIHYFYSLRETSNNHVSTLADARKRVVAVTQNAFEDKQLTKRGFSNLMKVSSPNQMVNMLFTKRVDLLFGSEIAITNLARQANRSPDEMIRLFTIENWGQGLWIAFSKKTKPDVVDKYRRAFIQLQQTGELAKIKEKHLNLNFIRP